MSNVFYDRHGKYWLVQDDRSVVVSSYDFYIEASKSTNIVEEIRSVFTTFKIIRNNFGQVIGSCKEYNLPQ